jgi:hypothetical protein
MAEDLFGIKRRIGGKSVTEKDMLPYLQREVMPELKAIRGLLDRMLSASLESVAATTTGRGLSTNGIQTSFAHMATDTPTTIPPSVRFNFDASQYPATNLAKVRRIDIEYWVDADIAGGSPEVALFRRVGQTEIANSRVSHTGGMASAHYLATDLPVGDGTDELVDGDAQYNVKARDAAGLVEVVLLQARMIVRYVDPEV